MEYIYVILFAISFSYLATAEHLEIPYTIMRFIKGLLNKIKIANTLKIKLYQVVENLDELTIKREEKVTEYTILDIINKIISCGMCLTFWFALFISILYGFGFNSFPIAIIASAMYLRFIIER